MNNKLKVRILRAICIFLISIIVFLIACIFGLRERADNLQTQLNQYVETKEENLLPCPICGHEVKLNPINDSFYIECEKWMGSGGCGLTTGYYKSKNELIEQWNGMNQK